MMGNQNDKQRCCFWSFMDELRRRGMTPGSPVGTRSYRANCGLAVKGSTRPRCP